MKQRAPRSHLVRALLPLFLLAVSAVAGGCTAFPARSQQVWRSLVNHDYPSAPAGSPEFEAALDEYTATLTRPGASARLLQNGDEAYPAMLELIASARTRISLETYIVDRDETTDRFFDALKAAAARGVEVRVLADAAGFRRGVVAQLHELDDHGIQARVFNPLLLSWTVIRGNNRDHRKILVVDGEYAVLGGINISDEQAGDGIEGWRDTSLLVTGEAAFDAETVFAETWEQAGRAFLGRTLPLTILNPLKRAAEKPLLELVEGCCGQARFVPPPRSPPEAAAGLAGSDFPFGAFHTVNAAVRVVSSAPDTRNSPTYDLAIIGVNGARERLDIACAYFVPPLGLRRALLAAAERGVRVRLLLPGVTDVMLVREIGMRFYGDLLRAGARIYEWPHPILHSKTMTVDGRWTVVGSANMDGRSYFLNYEACLAVTDADLAETSHAQFERDLLRAKELSIDEWERRGAKQKALEVLLIPAAGQY